MSHKGDEVRLNEEKKMRILAIMIRSNRMKHVYKMFIGRKAEYMKYVDNIFKHAAND